MKPFGYGWWAGVACAWGLAWALPAMAADQTPGFSAVTPFQQGYSLTVREKPMAQTPPSLHSFASGYHDGEWLMVAGRTNGLHGFSNDGLANFPPAAQNGELVVINPDTEQVWTRSLTDTGSPLTAQQANWLEVTNPQWYLQDRTLYVAGGYVYNAAAAGFETSNVLTAIDLPNAIEWVKTGPAQSTMAPNTILQTTAVGQPDYLRATGGAMWEIDDEFHLVFGQDFDGGYFPGANGDYLSQVRSFDVDYDMAGGTLTATPTTASPATPDDAQYRRRDLNVMPTLRRDPVTGDLHEELIAFAGVFYQGSGGWTVPVEIDGAGTPTMVDPVTHPNTFRQAMHHYESAHVGVYSETDDTYTAFLFGGISLNAYDPASGTLSYDALMPFNAQISAVTRDAGGAFSQAYVGEYPLVLDVDGDRILLGTNARFFPADGMPLYDNQLMDLDQILALVQANGPVTIGYIFGGIGSDAGNFGNTAASNLVFEVVLAIPEPATVLMLAIGVAAGLAYVRPKRELTAG